MKRTSIVITLLLIILAFACKESKNKETVIYTKKEVIVDKKIVLDTTQNSKTKNTTWSKNTSIAEGIIYRSGEENSWKSVFATNIFGFKKKPKIGDYAQIIPLRNDLSVLELKINKTDKRNDVDENDSKFDWYSVFLESVKNKDYWTVKSPKDIRAEYPSDVLVVYPPIKNAVLLDSSKLTASDVPKNTAIDVIKGALDFDGDSLPEALVVSFCCNDKTTHKDCEYECSETYLKIDGKWTLIDSSKPL